jgi:O-antigen ligase
LVGAGYFWPAVLILAGIFLSAAFSVEVKIGAGIFKSWILEPIIFGAILFDILKTRRDLKLMVWALASSSALVALVALFYKLFGQLTFDGRLAAFYLSPNHLAMYLVPGLIAGFGLYPYAKKPHYKALLLIAYCLLLMALYFTYSYGAWLALLTAGLFILGMFFGLKAVKQKKTILAGVGFLLLILALLASQLGSEKLNNLLQWERSSWQSRLMVWQSADKILADNWLLGIGPGLFQQYYLNYQQFVSTPYLEWAVPQPHNLFLAWWLGGGLLGLTGFLLLVFCFFKTFFLAKQKPSFAKAMEGKSPFTKGLADKQLLSIFLVAAVVYILVHGLADTTYWKNDLALVFWSVISLGYITIRLDD